MKNFFNFMRHTQLINFKIVVYSCKEIVELIKGKSTAPSISSDKLHEYLKDFQEGNGVKPLPMGAYEYDCCVEYLKMFRKEFFKNRKDFSTITLVFGEDDKYGIVLMPVEDCLLMVAKEVGLELVEENLLTHQSEYVFKSLFFENAA